MIKFLRIVSRTLQILINFISQLNLENKTIILKIKFKIKMDLFKNINQIAFINKFILM
jgi:hypothetical protein